MWWSNMNTFYLKQCCNLGEQFSGILTAAEMEIHELMAGD